ncbi:MAG TPA: glycosyltransferase [Chitinophagaceae bacterium]|jgi:glycosyltransferase involved in cell wall biosynthesis|nr:glycosyltransferase [Chitinophagaceae bacterium]
MRILLSIANLKIGGAQKVVLTLARELSISHEVFIYDHFPDIRNEGFVLQNLDNRIALFSISENKFVRAVLWKINALFNKLGIENDFFGKINKLKFQWIIKKYAIQVVGSHMFLSDYIVSTSKTKKIPIVISLHGCYEEKFALNKNIYGKKIEEIGKRINGIVYLTDKNLLPIRYVYPQVDQIPKIKLPNGIDLQHTSAVSMNENFRIISMAARCVKEKGWDIAIQAFLQLQQLLPGQKILLRLIGDGPYLQTLKEKYSNFKNIEFTGWVENPEMMISNSYLGILPSESESFPMVILEYLKYGIPFVSSNAGESGSILCEDLVCGTVIPNEFPIERRISLYSQALLNLMQDSNLYDSYAKNAKKKVIQFSLPVVAQNYSKFLEKILSCN